jgi:hypothetical protein
MPAIFFLLAMDRQLSIHRSATLPLRGSLAGIRNGEVWEADQSGNFD